MTLIHFLTRGLNNLGDDVYITIDIDGFDPAYAPGTAQKLDMILDGPYHRRGETTFLELATVFNLYSEVQLEEIQNPDASLIAAVKRARWFKTVVRACRGEKPHEIANVVAMYMLCKKYGRERDTLQDFVEANLSGAAATCAQTCLKHAWEDRSISP